MHSSDLNLEFLCELILSEDDISFLLFIGLNLSFIHFKGSLQAQEYLRIVIINCFLPLYFHLD